MYLYKNCYLMMHDYTSFYIIYGGYVAFAVYEAFELKNW